MNKTALITGINGQDGSYLAEFLLEKGYNVVGMLRRVATRELNNISHLLDKITIVYGDMSDMGSLENIVRSCKPDEIYNLAAQSYVAMSWLAPIQTGDITGLGAVRLLEAARQIVPHARFYQASSSEMFGKVQSIPQNERTVFYPRSPYAAAKIYSHWMTINYRESYGIYCVNGILFNHESPRRGLEFVTRKISMGVAKIYYGLQKELLLGNLDAKRDWGYAGDYIKAMWLMLQQKEPKDYVIATGETHSVREFAEIAFGCVGLNCRDFVQVDPKLYRPVDVDLLLGDSSCAKNDLGWKPTISFERLVHMMVESDLNNVRRTIE